MRRYLNTASLFVVSLMTAAIARGDGTDCNNNGVPDAAEIWPLPGHALVFDGAGDYVDPGASSALADLGQGDFTIEAWIRTDDPGHSILVGNAGNASALYNFVIRGNDEGGIIRLRLKDGTSSYTCDGKVTVNDGTWHHVAASRWASAYGTIRLYVDGQDAGECYCDYQGNAPFTADNPTLIGRDLNQYPAQYDGAMDELRVWSVGRYGDDIQADMYRVLTGNEPGLVAYWRFDEGEGSVAHDSAGDSDGTLVGSTAWLLNADCNENDIVDECEPGSTDDCNVNGAPDFCDIYAELSPDCNGNTIPDECDIADGVSQDCNENDVPDECEAGGLEDCNSNGAPDLCDIYEGISLDCNGTSIPDECEGLPTGVIYVDDDATSGRNDGSSWTDAFVDLQDALAYAACSGRVTEIRMAGGTYKPGNSRADRFGLPNGVSIRGGYRGVVGGGGPDDRNIDGFATILSGDIGEIGEADDNSWRLLLAWNLNASAMIEGITVTGADSPNRYGGGVCVAEANLTIAQCKFVANRAARGGGVCVDSGFATLVNCTFSSNTTTSRGGGVYVGTGGATLKNCTFDVNSSFMGGGLSVDGGVATLANCTFRGNKATIYGGGVYNEVSSVASLVNCTLVGNTAGTGAAGGGGYAVEGGVECQNCIIWGNTAGSDPQAYRFDISSSCVQGGWFGIGNISSDPLFVDADGPDDVFGTADDDVHLQEGSPCINKGNNGAIPSGVTIDFDGEPRIQQCKVDMGADETPYLITDCNNNGVDDSCELSSGSSEDCNLNGVPDECDIADGVSLDCNENSIPDECDGLPLGVIYVDDNAGSGSNNGASWSNAFVQLRDALRYAECNGQVSEIRVAGGTYKPGTSRNDSFHLLNGVTLVGGYRGLAGGGDSDDRDVDAHVSVLSADIGSAGFEGDNCYQIVIGSDTDETAVLDGFTITRAYASSKSGGGIYISQGSPTIANCTITTNKASGGGGMYLCNSSNPTVTGCIFINNRANMGGGMESGSLCKPMLVNCSFRDNSAEFHGGGMKTGLSSEPTLVNCTFSGNSGTFGGGLHASGSHNLAVVNCTFAGNSASCGGGICIEFGTTRTRIENCIMWGNSASSYPQIQCTDSSEVTNCCVEGGWTGTGNIGADPLFVDADGPDNVFGTADDDFHLLEGSPCINVGNNAAIPSGVTTDFEGEQRIQQDRVDMGAYESPYSHNDCNNNGVPDAYDIASGVSADEDGDGIPDECPSYGDCDHDGDVDLNDYNEMLSCMLGPDVDSGGDCDCFDADGDSDVDLNDFALFQAEFTGPQE